ncbi:unnamed protein product [Anisakis simplex]|uniref:Uncharacterized protein n=1 Tax=Anisakis simplex TaxID=6269 RepID=A0A3P6P5A2_ANISI|nr:unnamed protein product [Anisakis simplex]
MKRLKHLVVLAGLRFNYKKMFDGIESDKKKIDLLKEALTNKGVTTLSAEGCKSFKLKREEEQELAELSSNRIIEPNTS